jgi:hypothetical protein
MHESVKEISVISSLAGLDVCVVFRRAIDGAVLEGAGFKAGGGSGGSSTRG